MHTRRHVCTHSLSQTTSLTVSHTRKTFRTKRGLRFAAIVVIAAIVSMAIAVLAFAQKPDAILRGAPQNLQRSRVAIPRRAAAVRKGSRANQLSGANQDQDQDQEQSGRDQQRKGQGSRGPREGRVRKARPFKGDVRQLPYTQPTKVERPEMEAPEPNPSRLVPP